MKRSIPWQAELSAVVLVAAIVFFATRVGAVDPKPTSEFSQPTIDIGCFVSDPDKSVAFYTEAIGFQEVSPFSVPGDFCKAAGLTDGEPLENIRVLVLGEGPGATRLKLSSIPQHTAKRADNSTVGAQYGFRYLTLRVTDQNAALARLEKAGVKPLREGPVALPKSLAEGVYLTIVADPDGNLIELVGPKK
jgi:lactoylglutathione lyase